MLTFRRPSPALVVSFIALFIAASGGAWAASHGSGHAKAHAKAAKSSPGPRGPRGFRGDTGPRGPQGAQGPQGPTGPSDGFVKNAPGVVGLPSGTDTIVTQLSLTPDNAYIVTASTELGNASGTANLISCSLLENNNPIATGSGSLPSLNVFAQTITLTAATTGGNIKVSCSPDASAQARHTVITAVKVGTLHTQ